ncbi:hypothetical protein J2X31_003305 [Flavobacterium arsenatis]|uniref:Uncharacterized protein n=1 Tax=Flavobacterium arsenatis TaxID=1484332 RepID=A0ABU1TTS1_9FLAO|nr:hypothetical protein [Flavobacterium arsenatis]
MLIIILFQTHLALLIYNISKISIATIVGTISDKALSFISKFRAFIFDVVENQTNKIGKSVIKATIGINIILVKHPEEFLLFES